MSPAGSTPERIELAPGLEISRIVTGLWQVADMERDGRPLDLDRAAADMARYAEAGFDAFDMADHYGSAEPAAIKDAIRKVVDPNGTVIYAGKDEFAKALQLIEEGKPIKYEGVIGPVTFDEFGDITGPFRLWRIQNGEVTTVGEMTTAEVDALKADIDK